MSVYFAICLFSTMTILAGCASNRDTSNVRDRLLSHTPIGSDATNVLKYVIDDLRPKSAFSYYKYVDALQAGRHLDNLDGRVIALAAAPGRIDRDNILLARKRR